MRPAGHGRAAIWLGAVFVLVAAACSGSGDPTDASEADSGPEVTIPSGSPPATRTTDHIRVDQFGYRQDDPKVAVIADPQEGADAEATEAFEPGSRYEVQRWPDGEIVHAGAPEPWAGGAVHPQSGDRGWWFDFSAVDEPGTYVVVDVERGVATGPFDIGDEVYDDVLDAALRAFWFNRANTPHPADLGGNWSDEAAFVGPGQDTEARSIDAPDDATTALDLRGGWFDAGDTNKYVTFAAEPVHQLLTAYERHPDVFDDDVGIPESGNGVPDVVDEVRWELDWLARMQRGDGGVLIKEGITEWSTSGVPSEIDLPRYYEEVCSSSTVAAAAMFAHAAVVFGAVPGLEDEAAAHLARAEDAWAWYRDHEHRDDCDPQAVKAGDADVALDVQDQDEVVAAAYLFAATGDPAYDTVVREGYASTLPFADAAFGRYRPEQAGALLAYHDAPGADAATVQAIDERIASITTGSGDFGFAPDADLYRAFLPDEQYHWGSNRVQANTGTSNLVLDGYRPGGLEGGLTRGLGHLQYFHGVNPLGLVYLSAMGELGAERSVSALFHFWFGDDPAPGFVPGGPNRDYSGEASPPASQPPMKSYVDAPDTNGGEPVWEIVEPAIYYQAAYVRLLSEVLGGRPSTSGPSSA